MRIRDIIISETEPSTDCFWGHKKNGEFVFEYFGSNGWETFAVLGKVKESQLQSDWTQEDSTKKDYIKNKPLPYEISKVADYTYQMYCDTLDYSNAIKWFEDTDEELTGACSSVRAGNFYGRNYDWTYDGTVDFVVKTPRCNGRYATIGFGGTIMDLSAEFVESGEYSSLYKIVPFKIVDGINEKGVVCNINVVPKISDITHTTPNVDTEYTICSRMLPRFVLDKFATAKEAAEYIRDHVSVYNYKELQEGHNYDLHLMIADKYNTYLIEFMEENVGGETLLRTIIQEMQDKAFMTNFHLSNVIFNEDGSVYTPYDKSVDVTQDPITVNNIHKFGVGLERYNLINSSISTITSRITMLSLMDILKYTNAYKDPETTQDDKKWYSEVVGDYGESGEIGLSSNKAIFDGAYATMYDLYENRRRETADTWQTIHSCVYDIENRSVNVKFQEEVVTFQFEAEYQKQVDWNQNDNTAKDYIKNRIAYDTRKTLVPSNIKFIEGIDGKLIGGLDTGGYIYFNPTTPCITGQTYRFSLSNGLYFDVTPSGEPDNSMGGGGGYVNDPSTGAAIGGGLSWNINGLPDAPNNETMYVSLTTSPGNFEGVELFVMIGTEGELHKIDNKYLEKQVQADWNQKDNLKADYIKNKICSEENSTTTFFNDTINLTHITDPIPYNEGYLQNCTLDDVVLGKEYKVTINDVTYTCVGSDDTGVNSILYGNYGTKTNFIAIYKINDSWYIETDYGSFTEPTYIKLTETTIRINKIDDKFINFPCYKKVPESEPIYINDSEVTASTNIEEMYITIQENTLDVPFSEGEYIKIQLGDYKTFEGTVKLYNGNCILGNPVFFNGYDNELPFGVQKVVNIGGYVTLNIVWERDVISKTFAAGEVNIFNPVIDVKTLDEEMIPQTIARESSLGGVQFKTQNNNLYTSLDGGTTWLTVSVS